MAACGAKVLQLRSVEFARNHDVRLHVRSTFSDAEGTWIVDEEDPSAREGDHLRCGAHRLRAALPRREIDAGDALRARSPTASVNVDTILQVDGATRSSSARRSRTAPACEELLDALDVEWSMRDDLGKVSLIGAGMKSHPGIAAKTFATLDGIGVEARSSPPRRSRSPATSRPSDVARAVRRCTTPSSWTNAGAQLTRAHRRRRRDRRGRHGHAARSSRERGYENVRAFASARSAGGALPSATASSSSRRRRRRRSRPATSTSASSPSAPSALARARAARRRAAARSRRQVVGLPARATAIPLVVPEVNGAARSRRSSTTASSPTRTAARSRSPACSSRCTTRPGCGASASRPTSRSRARARSGWRRCAPRRPPSTTSSWTGTGTATSPTRSRSSAPRRARSSSCPSCRSARRLRARAGAGRPLRGGLDRDRGAALARAGAELLAAAPSRARARAADVPDAEGRRRQTTRCSSAASAATARREQRPRALPRVRQPAQGRRAERDPDRRAAAQPARVAA